MKSENYHSYEFDNFRVDPRRRLLLHNGRSLPLPPKALDLLLILIENCDRVVSKQELMHLLWPNAVVEESNLTQNIFLLRRALGEDAQEHRYIVTIPGFGYHFVSHVQSVAEAGNSLNQEQWGAEVTRSIAVIPFRTFSTNPGDEYLGPGFAEALTTRLSEVPGLIVRPTWGNALNGDEVEHEPQQIGRRLHVASLILGTMVRQGRRIRAMVEHVRVRDGVVDWASQFEGRFAEIFVLQDEMAAQVVSAVTSDLTREHREPGTRRNTENIDAYLTYLQGRYSLARRTPRGFRKAAECFEKATQMDPRYALAFAGLADCNCLLAFYNVDPPLRAWPKAKAAVLRALEIDNGLAEAHSVLALVKMAYEWNWQGAEDESLRAISLNPVCAMAHDYYASYLAAMGRLDQAITAIGRARELEPLSLIINCDMGRIMLAAGKAQEAVKQLENTVSMDPGFALGRWLLGYAYEVEGLFSQAVVQFQEAFSLFDKGLLMLASLGRAYAVSGDTRQAYRVVSQLLEASKQHYLSPFGMALLYAGLGDKNQAFSWLERACVEKAGFLIYLRVDARWDPLRDDRRFRNLLHRLHLVR